MRISTTISTAVAALTMAAILSPGHASAQEFQPEEDVTFVVPFGAGGGSDVLARTIVQVIEELDLVPTNIVIENRPGGSGAIGYTYISEQAGNPHILGTVSVSFFTTPLLGASPVSYEDFTPVAAIAMSPYILVVPTDSDIESIEDLKTRERITTGTVGVVSDAALLARMMQDQSDVTIDAVPFDGEGEVLSGLLGGHLDVMFGNPGEIKPQIDAGTLRPLAVSTGERLPSLPDVPTLKESGFDIEHVQLRGIVMPPDVPEAAVDYWEGVFRQVAESEEWKVNYLDKFLEEPRFLGAEDFAEELERTNELYVGIMEQVDVAQ